MDTFYYWTAEDPDSGQIWEYGKSFTSLNRALLNAKGFFLEDYYEWVTRVLIKVYDGPVGDEYYDWRSPGRPYTKFKRSKVGKEVYSEMYTIPYASFSSDIFEEKGKGRKELSRFSRR